MEEGRGKEGLTTGSNVLLYSDSHSPSFKFWTHETTYALGHLLKPAKGPTDQMGINAGQANSKLKEQAWLANGVRIKEVCICRKENAGEMW